MTTYDPFQADIARLALAVAYVSCQVSSAKGALFN
jgi:hypothetical protein